MDEGCSSLSPMRYPQSTARVSDTEIASYDNTENLGGSKCSPLKMSLFDIVETRLEHFSCLAFEPRLKHVPVLNAQAAEQERVVRVRVEVGTVTAVLSRIEVVRASDHCTVLSSEGDPKYEQNGKIYLRYPTSTLTTAFAAMGWTFVTLSITQMGNAVWFHMGMRHGHGNND